VRADRSLGHHHCHRAGLGSASATVGVNPHEYTLRLTIDTATMSHFYAHGGGHAGQPDRGAAWKPGRKPCKWLWLWHWDVQSWCITVVLQMYESSAPCK